MDQWGASRAASPLNVCVLALAALLLTSGAKLNTSWLVPSGQVKIDQQLLTKAPAKICALTFDDGPDKTYTPQVAAILKDEGVRATFFVVGRNIASFGKQVQGLAADGHEIANHSWSHPKMSSLSKASQQEQITKTSKALADLGITPRWFRPPYGEFSKTTVAVAREQGLETVLWSVDPLDWMKPGADKIKARVLKDVSPGGVILLHSTHSQTVEMLPELIAELRDKGYSFVTMSEWREAVTGKLDYDTLQRDPVPLKAVPLEQQDEPQLPPQRSLPPLSSADPQDGFAVHSNFSDSTAISDVFRRGGTHRLVSFDHTAPDDAPMLALQPETATAVDPQEQFVPPPVSLEMRASAPSAAEPQMINERSAAEPQALSAPAETEALDIPAAAEERARYIEPEPNTVRPSDSGAELRLLQTYDIASASWPWASSASAGQPEWFIAHLGSASRFDDLAALGPFIELARLDGLLLAGNNPARPGALPFKVRESRGQPKLSYSLDLSREGIPEVLDMLLAGHAQLYLTLAPGNDIYFAADSTLGELPQVSQDLLLLRLMTAGLSLDRSFSTRGWGLPAGLRAARFSAPGGDVLVLCSGNAAASSLTLPEAWRGGRIAALTDDGELGLYEAPAGSLSVSRRPLILYYNRQP